MGFWLKLALICCTPAILLAQSRQAGSVAGHVLDVSTGNGISGALVRLSPLDALRKIAIPPAISGSDGSFRFESVPAARYLLVVRKSGFVEDPGPEGIASVTVKPNQSIGEVLIPLMPLGTITGTIVDEHDTPLAGVQVDALMLDPTFAPARLELADVHAVTDRAGHYSLSKLPGGSYYVLALPSSRSPRARKDGYQLIPTFFPNACCPDDAIRVFVQPGQNISADLTLPAVLTHRIDGGIADISPRVRGDDLQLEISPIGERHIAVLRRRINIRPDRTFAVEGIPSGHYEITLSVPHAGQRVLVSKDEVEVGSSDLTGITITPMQSITVSGLVRRDNNLAPIGPVGFRLVPLDEGISYGEPAGADGFVKIDGVEPNRYLIQVFPSAPGLYVSSLELNHHDISNQYVDLSAYSLVQVTAILRSGAGVISGTVNDGIGMVVLSPKSPSPDGSNVHEDVVRSGHRFEFRNVPPGDYLLYGAQETNRQLWFQASFLAALKDLGAPVHLDENGNQHVQSVQGIEQSVLRARARVAGFYFE